MIIPVFPSLRGSRAPALLLAGSIAVVVLASTACAPPPAPLMLEGNRITVENRTRTPWLNVEIWINRQYRLTQAQITPGERFQSPLDAFVEGFGHRFDYRRQQIRDVRLKAKAPNGEPVEIVKEFEQGGLAGLAQDLKKK